MFKKICALVLAIAMVLVMGSVAMAAGDAGRSTGNNADTYSGAGNTNAKTGTGNRIQNNAIPITKSIVFINENNSPVYEPNIIYTYSITPLKASDLPEKTHTVHDGTLEGYVHPGVTGGVSSSVSIQFGTVIGEQNTTAVTTSANGTDVERTTNITVTPATFGKPGIYRYKIEESASPAVTAAGLTARTDNYNTVRYLDVYIHYEDEDGDETTPETLQMYGAVIFKSTAETAGQDNITTTTTKTTGYEPTNTTSLKTDDTVDRYTTYDFTVKKTVSGTMADKKHEFPFYVTVSNSISGAKFTYTADSAETFTGMTVTNGAATLSAANFSIGSDGKGSNLTLKHNDTIKLVGVPSNQTTELAVVIKEFNDTYDKYTPSADATKGDISMTAGTAMTADTGSDTTSSFTVKTNDVADQILTIENNLEEISPTGVVLRVAPYVLILGAGLALLLISRRRKTASEEE